MIEIQKQLDKQYELKNSLDKLENELKENTKDIKDTLKEIESKYKPQIKETKDEYDNIRNKVIQDINSNPDYYLKNGKTHKFFDYTMTVTETKKPDIKNKWKLLFELKDLKKLDIVELKFDDKQLAELIKLGMVENAELVSEYNYKLIRTNDND